MAVVIAVAVDSILVFKDHRQQLELNTASGTLSDVISNTEDRYNRINHNTRDNPGPDGQTYQDLGI